MFREGIRARLEKEPGIEIVGEASSGGEAIAMLSQNPSMVILDIRLPDISGIEVASQIRKQNQDIKIIMLTGYDFSQYVRALARLGIDGYLLKDSPQEELVHAIREIASGGVVLPPKIASKFMREYSANYKSEKISDRRPWDLTLKEIDILEFMSLGLKNAEIAQRLEISARTVENHVSSIMGKLGATSRTEAVRIGSQNGLIK